MVHYSKICPKSKAPIKDADDALNQMLQKKGYVHEDSLIEVLEAQGKTVFTVADALTPEQKKEQTLSAMARGEEVIFQALLEEAPFKGFADFLIKVPCASKWGDYHYEVWGTKLSCQVKAKFLNIYNLIKSQSMV